MTGEEFCRLLSEVDEQYVVEAWEPQKRARPWVRWCAAAACAVLVAAASLTVPPLWQTGGGTTAETAEPESGAVQSAEAAGVAEGAVDEGGALAEGGASTEEQISLLADEKTVREIQAALDPGEAASWSERPEASFDFSLVLPLYVLDALPGEAGMDCWWSGFYLLPVVSGGETCGTAAVTQQEGKWVVSSYTDGFDLPRQLAPYRDRALCAVQFQNLAYGLLLQTEDGVQTVLLS